jgi:hypothetical protein
LLILAVSDQVEHITILQITPEFCCFGSGLSEDSLSTGGLDDVGDHLHGGRDAGGQVEHLQHQHTDLILELSQAS